MLRVSYLLYVWNKIWHLNLSCFAFQKVLNTTQRDHNALYDILALKSRRTCLPNALRSFNKLVLEVSSDGTLRSKVCIPDDEDEETETFGIKPAVLQALN